MQVFFLLISLVAFLSQVESALPTLARPIMSLDANEDAIVGALKQSLVPYSYVLFHSFCFPLLVLNYFILVLMRK